MADTTGLWERVMHWLYLVAAIALEVCGTTAMKLSEGFTRTGPSVAMAAFYAASLGALTMALQHMPVSMAYAIWSGLGTALITAVGVVWFREPLTSVKLLCVVMIIAGVVGLHLGEGH